MKNMTEKKVYSMPKMRIVKLKQRSSLLCQSGDCADGAVLGYNASPEENYKA